MAYKRFPSIIKTLRGISSALPLLVNVSKQTTKEIESNHERHSNNDTRKLHDALQSDRQLSIDNQVLQVLRKALNFPEQLH